MSEATATDHGDSIVALTPGGPRPGPQQIAVVPGEEVPVLRLDLPPGLRGQAREQVARRQLQDRAGLNAQLTEVRPVQAAGVGEAWQHVLIVDAARLRAWKEQAGGQCRALLPDYLMLPAGQDIWTVAAEGEMLRTRLGPQDGFSAQTEVATALLARALQEVETAAMPKAILHLGPLPEAIAALAARHDIPLIDTPEAAAPLGLAVPKVLAHDELAWDLRRDPQLARARLRRRVLPWRWPLLFAAVAAGLWAATLIVETRRLEAQTAALQTSSRELARAHFVPAGPLLDLRVQVARVLDERRAGATAGSDDPLALDLFARAADVLAAQRLQAEQANSISESEVALEVVLPDFASVDRLAAALRDAGLGVDVVESRVTDGSAEVRSDIRLTNVGEENGG